MNIISTNTRLNAGILWGFALLFLIIGLLLSKQDVLDNLWLSRAGCLIAMLGIWSSIGGLIQQKILLESISFRRQLLIAAAWRRHWADDQAREEKIATINKLLDERKEKVEHRTEMSVGILEASLLLTGTFFWGFGDLVIYII